jgi:DNA-binding transcriptional MerR regulator
MNIGQLAERTGLTVRTLRFYADAGVLPEAGRTEAGYRLFGVDAVARGRLVRTLRELGVGLTDVRRVLSADASLSDIAAAHVRALDAQIRTLSLQRAVLAGFIQSTDPKELERMTELINLSAEERRRILDEYLDAVFGEHESAVADKLRMGAPELPEDPSPDQVAAWTELVELLRDPEFIAASRGMAERARAEGADQRDVGQATLGKAVGRHAGGALRDGLDPAAPDALAIVERIESETPGLREDRTTVAERIEAFSDRRVARYWTLVGIVNGWPQVEAPTPEAVLDAWEWYARALRAHA